MSFTDQHEVGSSVNPEVVISRVFNAPRELVFAAWTDPEHVARWWAPGGVTMASQEMTVKPGGIWRFVMHDSDGTSTVAKVVYHEVDPPERLVFVQTGGDGLPVQRHITITLAEQGGGTILTMRVRFPVRMLATSAAERARVEKETESITDTRQSLARLADHLAAITV